jgi:hypothetical protein
MQQLLHASHSRLGDFPPEALSGLFSGLAASGAAPSEEWLKRFSVASFACLSSFTAQVRSHGLLAPRTGCSACF